MKKIVIIAVIIMNGSSAHSQEKVKLPANFFHRVTVGEGVSLGISPVFYGGSIDYCLQKKNNAYSFVIRGQEEFNLFDNSNVNNLLASFDVTYGRVYLDRSLLLCLNAGLGLVHTEEKGKLLYREGGWFFGYNYYKKIIKNIIGLPVNARICWLMFRHFGIGTELYANLNGIRSFAGINVFMQFGRLRKKK